MLVIKNPKSQESGGHAGASFALQLLSRVKAPGKSLRTSEGLAQEVSEGKEVLFLTLTS